MAGAVAAVAADLPGACFCRSRCRRACRSRPGRGRGRPGRRRAGRGRAGHGGGTARGRRGERTQICFRARSARQRLSSLRVGWERSPWEKRWRRGPETLLGALLADPALEDSVLVPFLFQ